MNNVDTSRQEAWDRKMREAEALRSALLKPGGGDGTSGGDMDIVDAKIAAAEARTDSKFAELNGSLNLINERLDNIARVTGGLRSTIILTAIAAVGVVLGAMAFGASQFGNGVMVTTVAVQDAAEAKRISQQTASDLAQMREDMAKLVQAVTQKPNP